jgi:hypothetical protein
MTKIIDANGKETSEAGALKGYFGLQPGQSLAGFMAEVKQLTPEDKTELAVGAAKALGWSVVES